LADDGFIQQFSSMILDSVPTSPKWADSIACSMLSTAIGSNIVTKTRVGPLNLNVWFMIVGSSGISHKTTPLKYHARPMVEELETILDTDLMLPSRFSIEGMIEYFSKYSPAGVVIRDEFTSVFKDMQKDYLTDFTEFLSEVYDCSVQKRFTRATKLEETRRVYVNLLAATTPYLYQILKYDFFIQGTGNRIMFILDSAREPRHEDSDSFFASAQDVETENESKRRVLATSLASIRNSALRMIQPDSDAGNLLTEFKYKTEFQLSKRFSSNPYDIYSPYMARMSEMTFKLTALSTLSRWYNRLGEWKFAELTSLPEDADWAIKKVEGHFDDFKKMVEAWRQRPETFTAKTYDSQATQVYDYLVSKDVGTTWGQMRNDMRWSTEVWSQVLRLLFDTKKIIAVEHKPEGAGRPTVVFYPPTLYEKALLGSGSGVDTTIEDWSILKMRLRL
jgi:hypothetical protein